MITLRDENFNKAEKRKSILFVFYAVFTVAIYTLPSLKVTLPYFAVALLMLASIAIFVTKDIKWLNFVLILCVGSLIVATINMLTGMYGIVDSINEMLRNIRFFLPALWGCYALKYCTPKHKKVFLFAFFVICGYMMIKTLIALYSEPEICRTLAAGSSSDDAYFRSYRMNNVGGFEYSYLIGIVTLGFVWTALYQKDFKIKLISVLLAVLGFYFIIQTMYTTLLILTCVGTLLLLFFDAQKKTTKILILILVVLLFAFMEPLLRLLADVFSFSSVLGEKFMNMYLALKYGDIDIIGSRPEYILRALKNWVINPIFGGKHENSNCHSLVMTYLENSGLVGLILWSYLFGSVWNLLRKTLKHYSTNISLFDVSMIYLLLLSLLNPIGYCFEIMFVAMLTVPVWVSVIGVNETDDLLT